MHELAICNNLLMQAERIASDHNARAVECIHLAIGPLSGVEPPLLERAFSVVRAGTLAADATLSSRVVAGPGALPKLRRGEHRRAQSAVLRTV
ncbi:MAG: hydrogenase maturation nickel metallochaperone HypA [Candidatus Competibacteraceae bacterium]